MPLEDGTNAEKEDVSPPLDWNSKSDVNNVVLHQAKASPPCVKIRQFLTYYQVPFTVVNGKKKGSKYTKIPVMMASGRQINDSYIILKNLIPVLCGEPFNQEWQDKITYSLQLALEVEVMGNSSDMAKLMSKGFGVPNCCACCIAGPVGRMIGGKIRAAHPNLPPSVDIGKLFAKEISGKNFFSGNDTPGQVDIAYFGTLKAFQWAGCSGFDDHIQQSGLQQWWSQMDAVMPAVL